MNISKVKMPFIYWLYLFLIAACVLSFTTSATFATFQDWDPYHYQKAQYISLTPSYQRFLKEFLIILLLIFSLFLKSSKPNRFENNFKNLHLFYILGLLIFAISLIRNLNNDISLLAIMLSARPIVYLSTLILFSHRHLNSFFILRVLKYSNFLLVIQAFYSFIQRVQGMLHQNISLFSMGNTRSTGTLAGPNSLGLYLSLMLVINLYILNKEKGSIFYSCMCLVGIFFSGSRTALMICIITIAFKLKDKLIGNFSSNLLYRILLDFILFFPAFIYLPLYVKDLSSRGGEGTELIGTRREIFLGLLDKSDTISILFGHHLGYGTNGIVSYNKEIGDMSQQTYAFISDSTPSYLFAQFGILIFPLILLFFYKLWFSRSALNYRKIFVLHQPKMPVSIYLICSSLTIILFEFYTAIVILVPLCFLLSNYPKKTNEKMLD